MSKLAGLVLLALLCYCGKPQQAPSQQKAEAPAPASPKPAAPETSRGTSVEMHNVLLQEDPLITLRIRWLRGRLFPARKGEIASFDDKQSFRIEIDAGVIGIGAEDLTKLLDTRVFAYPGSPLSKVRLSTQGSQIKLNGTLHKGVSMPIEMLGDVGATPDGKIRVHAAKLRALHIPVKGLLGVFGIKVADLIDAKGAKGISVEGNDVILNPEQILPPPHQRGRVTAVHVRGNDLVQIFGAPRQEVEKVRSWRNYMSFQGGTISFGKLTMREADLVMIDASNDAWFNFNLDRYHDQLAAGYSKITAQSGLRVFMPDFDKLKKAGAAPPRADAAPPKTGAAPPKTGAAPPKK